MRILIFNSTIKNTTSRCPTMILKTLEPRGILVQEHVLKELIKKSSPDTPSFERYESMLQTTRDALEIRRASQAKDGKYRCITGCSFSHSQHKAYISHLKLVHPVRDYYVCNFMKTCRSRFTRFPTKLVSHNINIMFS